MPDDHQDAAPRPPAGDEGPGPIPQLRQAVRCDHLNGKRPRPAGEAADPGPARKIAKP